MEGRSRALVAAVAALLVIVLASCGGGDSTASQDSEDFVPQQHHDSGGGAQQFKVTGPSTVQEFSTEASKAEFEKAAVVLHNFLDARAGGYWAAACTYMDKNLVNTLTEFGKTSKAIDPPNEDCPGVLEYLTKQESIKDLRAEAAQADAASLRSDGDLGYLIYRSTGDAVEVMSMIREGHGWGVDSLNAVPLTVN